MISLPTHRQLEVLYWYPGTTPSHIPLLVREPKCLILAGVGDGNEAELALQRWPDIKIAAFDPDSRAFADRAWIKDHFTREVALSDWEGTGMMSEAARVGTSTLHPQMVESNRNAGMPERRVSTTTLDAIDEETEKKLFQDAVLWIDAEGYDHRIISGAKKLLYSGRVLAVVMELWTARPDLLWQNGEARKTLHHTNFLMVEIFGGDWWGHNEVYIREIPDAVRTK